MSLMSFVRNKKIIGKRINPGIDVLYAYIIFLYIIFFYLLCGYSMQYIV